MDWTLFIDLLIKVSLLLGGILLLDAVWKNPSAAVRHRLWTWGCLFALLLPISSFVLPQYPLAILPSKTADSDVGESVSLGLEMNRLALDSDFSVWETPKTGPHGLPNPIDDSLLAEGESNGAATAAILRSDPSDLNASGSVLPPVKTGAETGTERLPTWLVSTWIIGVFVAMIRWLRGKRLIRSLMRDSAVITDTDIQQELARLCRNLGISWAVQIRESSTATVPMTWGIFFPVIMLPFAWRRWPPGAWQAALSHELAHIQRRDLACQLMARVTCTIYWFHPLTWYAARRIKVERELACDDCVVSLGQPASDYARHLVAIAKSCVDGVPHPAISMAQTSGLEQRVRAMFDHVRSHGPLSRVASIAIFAIAMLAAIPLMALQASLAQISRVTTVQTKPDVADWLPIDTAVVVHVLELPELIDKIIELNPLGDAAQPRIRELLTAPKFPVLNAAELPDVLAKVEACYDLLRQAERASVVIHRAKDGKLDWSLFVETNPDQQADLLAAMRDLTGAIEQAVVSTPEVDHDPEDILFGFLKNDKKFELDQNWCQVECLDSWVVVFNTAENFQQIRSRWENRDRSRSLGQSRKYARAMNQLASAPQDNQVTMQIYVNPVEVVEWIPYGNAAEWERLKIHELACVGANLFLSPNAPSANDSNCNMPLILLDTFVHYTQPVVGYAKMFQSYRPVKLPPLAVEPIELLAYARDEETFFRDQISLLDQATQPGATEQEWLRQLTGLEANWIWEMMDRRKSTVRTIYRNTDSLQDELLVIEEVNLLSSAEKFAEKTVAQTEGIVQSKPKTIEEPLYRRWRFETELLSGQELTWDSQIRDLPPAVTNPFHQAFALSDQWWINGQAAAVDKQLKLLHPSENSAIEPTSVDNKAKKIATRIEAFDDYIGSELNPVMIQYFTKTYWADQLRSQEWQYATSDMQSIQASEKVEKLSADNEETSKFLEEAEKRFGSRPILMLGSSEVAQPDGELKRVVNLYMPKPFNSSADEFGFWLAPLSRQDQLKLAQWTTLQALSQHFGEQIILWDRNDSSIRITLGIFSTSADDEDDGKQPESLMDYWPGR